MIIENLFEKRLEIIDRIKSYPRNTISHAWAVFCYEWNGMLIEIARLLRL